MDGPMQFYSMQHAAPMAPSPTMSQPFRYSPPDHESGHSDDFDESGLNSDGEGDLFEQTDPATGAKRKSRRPPSTAEKRANHNAIERARRESLNGRFGELARALPNMNGNKRPSKNAIVLRSLEFVTGARMREHALESQNASLRAEVNELRSKLGIAPIAVVSNRPTSKVDSLDKKPMHDYLAPLPIRQQHQQMQGGQTYHHVPNAGPYLPIDPIAAASLNFQGYGFIDRRPSLVSTTGSGHESDSEASLVHTPPQPTHGFAASGGPPPLFFGGGGGGDDVASAPRGVVNGVSGGYGLPHPSSAPATTVTFPPCSGPPTWNQLASSGTATSFGLGYNVPSTLTYPMYA